MKLHIDNYTLSRHGLCICGWGIGQDDALMITTSKHCILKTYPRKDMNRFYALPEDCASGFELVVPLYMRTTITFRDAQETRYLYISVFSYMKRNINQHVHISYM